MNLFKNFIFAVMSVIFMLISLFLVYITWGIFRSTIAAYVSISLISIMFFIFAKITEMIIIKKMIK